MVELAQRRGPPAAHQVVHRQFLPRSAVRLDHPNMLVPLSAVQVGLRLVWPAGAGALRRIVRVRRVRLMNAACIRYTYCIHCLPHVPLDSPFRSPCPAPHMAHRRLPSRQIRLLSETLTRRDGQVPLEAGREGGLKAARAETVL